MQHQRTFSHILTNYQINEWEELKVRVQPYIVYDINQFMPFFYTVADIQNQHYSKKFVYEILAEGRRFNKVAIFIFDKIQKLDNLSGNERRILEDNTVSVWK